MGDTVDATRKFLSAFAVQRRHLLRYRYGVPDERWSAQSVLRDYAKGALLHCEKPSSIKAVEDKEASAAEAANASTAASSGEADEAESGSEEETVFEEAPEAGGTKKLTRKAMRAMQKNIVKERNPRTKS